MQVYYRNYNEVMTIHQCVPNMSGDVTTRDLKPGPGTGDLAPHSAVPGTNPGPNYCETPGPGQREEEAISIHPKH